MKKIGMTIAEKTLEYVDEKAKEMGVNRSAMITFMIQMYKQQEKNLEAMNKIDILKQLSELEKNNP